MARQFVPTSGGLIETHGGLIGAAAASSPSPTYEPVTVDSFEDADLAEYTGDTASFSVVDASTLGFSAKDGTYILASNDGATGEISAVEGGGLPNYFPKGHEARVWFRFSSTPSYECRLNFGWADGSNNYLFRVIPGSDTLELGAESGGTYSALGTATITTSLTASTWYEAVLVWDDGNLGGVDNDITIQIRDESGTVLAEVTANNSANATNTGIAFRSWNTPSGSRLFWDYYRLTRGPLAEVSAAWIDNFDSQSLANYSTTNSLNDFTFTTTTTASGSGAALQSASDSDGSGYAISYPGDGLANYPARGDHIRGFIHSSVAGGVYQDFYPTHQDSNNYLMFEVEWPNDRVQLVNSVAGSATVPIDVRTAGLLLGTWYQVDIYWHDGSGANADGDIRIVITDPSDGTVVVDSTANVAAAASGGVHAGGPHGVRWGFYSQSAADELVQWDNWEVV